MAYHTAQALRTALEHRLLARSAKTGVSLDRLRRRVIFERIIARIQAAEPGHWVLKGGMALEVRLLDDARLTKDIDLGLRGDITSTVDLHERLIDILTTNLGMLRDFGERENSRVRDLVDLTILLEHDLLEPEQTAAAVQTVWLERNNTPPPHDLPPLPESWLDRYQRLAANHDINIPPYPAALAQVTQLWHHMFTRE